MLRTLTASPDIDIVLLTEVWLSCRVGDSELTLKDYSLLRRDLNIWVYGGVVTPIKSTIGYDAGAESISWGDQLSVFALKVLGPRKTVLGIAVLYRPLQANLLA